MREKKKLKKKLRNLIKNFGFTKDELTEIKKMYSGEYFDINDYGYQHLLQCSKDICNEYSTLLNEEMLQKNKSPRKKLNIFKFLLFYLKKSKILKLIFPIHGFVLYAEEGLQAVVGLVDLKGYGFINKNLTFTPNSLVIVKKSNIFAFNITIGDNILNTSGTLAKLSKITIESNCWIGAGTKIYGNVTIGNNAVIGCGAMVYDDIPCYSLAVGRPSKVIRKITSKDSLNFDRKITSALNGKQFDIVRQLSKGKVPKAFVHMVNGIPFNTMDKNLAHLINITRNLCFEYNSSETALTRKQEILDILFIEHGKNLNVGINLYVDMLGTIKIGDNVTIGNNVFIGGNINIDNNCIIENNTILFSSGHSLIAKERIMNWSITQGFYEYTQYKTIKVESDIKIEQNAIITPNSIVNCNVPKNSLYAKNKVIN